MHLVKITPYSAKNFLMMIRVDKNDHDKLVYENLFHLVKKNLVGKIIDIGCGRRNYLIGNIELNDSILIGMDIDFDSIKNKKLIKFGFISDVEKLALKQSSIDCAIMLDVAEHLKNPSKCLLQMQRCLKSEGSLIIITPNLYGFSGISIVGKILPIEIRGTLLKLFGYSPLSSPFHLFYRINSIYAIRKAAKNSLFKVEKIFLLPITPHWLKKKNFISFPFIGKLFYN